MRKEVKELSNKDILLEEYTLVNDKLHGVQKVYYETGELSYKTPYINGEKHGVARSYHITEELQYEVPYLNGKRHGIGIGYYQGGGVSSKTHYLGGERVNKAEYDNSLNSCEGKVVEIEGKKYELREIT